MSVIKKINRKAIFGIGAVLLAVGSYFLTLWATPYYVQYKISKNRVGETNVVRFAEKPSPENNRVVPLPNPDFLYSTIGYDLEGKVLKISGSVPDATYWSISGYQANTTNYFVANDNQLDAKFEYYLAKEGSTSAALKDVPKEKIIYSPTTRGLVLFRYLISKAYSIEALTQLQHDVKVETLVN
jgi:uncharacterized membrane protein